jgi:hypothetical protein
VMLPAALVASWATVWIAFACLVIARSRPPLRSTRSSNLSVLVVRPCSGDEPRLHANLVSVADAARRLGASVRIVMTVAHEADPAFPVALRAAEVLRTKGLFASAVVAATDAANQKAGQLAAVVDGDDASIVIAADSDVDLHDTDLGEVVGALERGAAASWCAPVEISPSSLADRVSAAILAGSLQAFVLLRRVDEAGLVGKLFALRMDALRDIGGFAGLTDRLGEDVELARRIRRTGGAIVAARAVAKSTASGRSLRAVVGRYVRWLVTVRAQRPLRFASYPMLIGAAPLVMVVAILHGLPTIAMGVAIVRIAVAVTARRFAGLPLDPVFDVLIADGVLLLAWFRAVVARRVVWRERELLLRQGGRIEVQPEA